MPLKVTSAKTGKTYEMPWTLPTDPSDDEVDRFIASQEASAPTNGPQPVKSAFQKELPVPSMKDIKSNFFKPAIPAFDTNDISLASESYPVRAGKELFNTFVSEASSPFAVSTGAAIGKVAQVAKPYLGKFLPFLSKYLPDELSSAGSEPIKVSPVDAPKTQLAPITDTPPIESRVSSPANPSNSNITRTIQDDILGKTKPAPLTKSEVANAAVVKESLGPKKVKPIVDPINPDGSYNLKNPSPETIDQVMQRGYEPTGEVNPDNSIKLVKKVGDVANPTPYDIDYKRFNELTRKATDTNNLTRNELIEAQQLNKALREVNFNPESYNKINKKPWSSYQGSDRPQPVSAPLDIKSPSFQQGGSGNGAGLPPTSNGPAPVNPTAPTPKPQKFSVLTQVGTNLKSATAGLDLSFLGRQGRAVMHKKEYYKAIPKMYEALKSEAGYNKLMTEITDHPNYPMFKDKISFTNLGDDLSQREEDLMGNLVEKIPGLGRLYRASNRANSGFINKVRFDLANSLLEDSMNGGNLFNTNAKGRLVDPGQIADLVNVMTGRGKLGKFEGAAPLLNAAMFSPRFLSSRAKLLTAPLSYMKADPFVRKEAIKSLAALVTSQATLLGFASALGMKHSFNPLNSDFAKFKVGNSRLDLNGGLQQLVVLASRLAPESIGGNRVQSSITGRTMKLDTGKFGAPTTQGTIGRFGESKEAPLLSLAMDLKTGKNFHGDPISPTESIVRHITPMVAQDLWDVADANPKYKWLKSPETLLVLPAIMGAGLQTYKKK